MDAVDLAALGLVDNSAPPFGGAARSGEAGPFDATEEADDGDDAAKPDGKPGPRKRRNGARRRRPDDRGRLAHRAAAYCRWADARDHRSSRARQRGPLAARPDRLGETFRLRVAPSVLAPRAADVASYLAASDETRARELHDMIRDPDVRAIVLARGGYGLMRILPQLDAAALVADPSRSWGSPTRPRCCSGPRRGRARDSWTAGSSARGSSGKRCPAPGRSANATESPGVRPWSLAGHGNAAHTKVR